MKKLIFYIMLLIFIISCGKRIERSKPIHQEEPQPVYYLENGLNSNFNLHGPVHTLSKMFMRRDSDSFFENVLGLPSYPLVELASYRGFFEFDTLGMELQTFKYSDSLDFIKKRKGGVGFLSFYNRDSFPMNINYKIFYNKDVIYPGVLKFSVASETVGANKQDMNQSVNRDSLYYFTFSYELQNKKVHSQYRQDITSDGTVLPFYDERIDYVYDTLNRIIREDYSYYEILDDWFPPTRSSHEYHNIKVGDKDRMQKIFSYDSLGNIANVEMYINDNYVFEEKYHYDKKANLTSKERIDPRHRYHPYHRSYRMVYTFDKYGNITQLDVYNEENELQEQLWVDYYDFDKYNNWQRCEMFLNNTHSGEPQLTGYRRITYYEE